MLNNCKPKHVGSRNELLGIAWLLECGFDVFKNVSPHGDTDIVAIQGNEVLRIDIKGVQHNTNSGRLTDAQIAQRIARLNVYPDGQCVLLSDLPKPKWLCRICGVMFSPSTFRHTVCSASCATQTLRAECVM